jgi:hypothetical protein
MAYLEILPEETHNVFQKLIPSMGTLEKCPLNDLPRSLGHCKETFSV